MIRGKDFYGGPMVKNLPTNAGDTGLIPGIWEHTSLWVLGCSAVKRGLPREKKKKPDTFFPVVTD